MSPPLIRTATHKWKPEVIVGIDFGMTCTGVAYVELNSSATSVPEIKNIQRWLGTSNGHLDDKVPTELIYTDRHEGEVQYWGSHCRKQPLRSYVKRLFKLNIASAADDVAEYGHDTDSARKYFKDYIAHVHGYIEEYLRKSIANYNAKRVEFVFSVPTTWVCDTETLNEVRRLICNVIGENNQYRKATIGLTEAAAAAVDIGRDHFNKGDVILVCDTGGGTTDFNIVKMTSAQGEAVRMTALTYDEGISVGSTRIDQAALDYIRRTVGEVPGINFPLLAEKAIYGNFQDIKHEYGSANSDVTYYPLEIPGIALNDRLPPEHFEGVCFKIPARRLKQWFDDQIDQVTKLGETQLQNLSKEHKKETVAWMVLSGGFGQNEYVREKLKEYLRSSIYPGVQVLSAKDPQLAVVRGLVHNQAQEAMGLSPVYQAVCTRMSYGIVIQERYRKSQHRGLPPQFSASDGKYWVQGQIDWIIEQGLSIPSSGLAKAYELILDEDDQNDQLDCHIVSCDLPRQYLPTNVSHKQVKSVCTIKVHLDKLPFTIKHKKAGLFRKKQLEASYKQVMFDLFIMIGAADVRFQVHASGEADTLVSEEHGVVDVFWLKDEEAAKVKTPISEERQPARSPTDPKAKKRPQERLRDRMSALRV